ncbi:MAG: acyl-CoA synthetase FdrA [Anaerolineales bacterium]
MSIFTRVLKNQYHDSVALMLATRALKEQAQIADAAYMMGTDVNKTLLKQGGLLSPEADEAQANDLIIAVRTKGDAVRILDMAEALLSTKQVEDEGVSVKPSTFRSAIRAHPALNTTVISIAGAYAPREAREALASGLNVLLFSDNVALEDEISLKKFALSRGLLLMGPGAGTAIINGVGLGFANAVPQGEIGIVSAAGTGLQEVSTLLARKGIGISQAIGTGGRDLSKAVGGLMFMAAIDALQADPFTRMILLISKPPDAEIVQNLFEKIKHSQKQIILCLLGAQAPKDIDENLHFTRTLEECALTAEVVMNALDVDVKRVIEAGDIPWREALQKIKSKFKSKQRDIRALYSGGTLCYEAQVIWKDELSDPVYSNAPLKADYQIRDVLHCSGHCALDLGEEEFTIGRPHPMIDNELRIQRLTQEAADPHTAVILFDVVLGYGAHPHPAEALAEAIKKILAEESQKDHRLIFLCAITGTEEDPQGYQTSKRVLQDVGVFVCDSNAQAARMAAFLVTP